MKCEYEGRFKAVRDGSVSKLYCHAHATDWLRHFPDARLVEPRKIDEKICACAADWWLPEMVPG